MLARAEHRRVDMACRGRFAASSLGKKGWRHGRDGREMTKSGWRGAKSRPIQIRQMRRELLACNPRVLCAAPRLGTIVMPSDTLGGDRLSLVLGFPARAVLAVSR